MDLFKKTMGPVKKVGRASACGDGLLDVVAARARTAEAGFGGALGLIGRCQSSEFMYRNQDNAGPSNIGNSFWLAGAQQRAI